MFIKFRGYCGDMKKVELHFPLFVSDSAYYKNLMEYPPKEYEYISKIKSGLIGNTVKRGMFRSAKSNVRSLATSLGFSRPLYARSKKYSTEFVHHFAHCIPKLRKSNGIDFVLDIEGVWQLSVGELSPSVKKKIINNLSRDECKAIMPWTNHVYNEFVKEFPELEHKTTLLRPAVKLMQTKKKVYDPESFTMLYVARDFELKNGHLACDIMNSYADYNNKVNAICIANVDMTTKIKYPNVSFFDLMPKDELYKYYRIADLMIYPSPIDTFGFAIIEAMSFGVPTIAMKTQHTKSVEEIIVNGYNGHYFTEDIFVKGAIQTITSLINDRDYWQKISNQCLYTIINGPYSINNRNKKLREILEICTKK